MKKYVNGKMVEMTEKDIARRKTRKLNRNSKANNTSNETRIKELEKTVADLLIKLNESEAAKEEQ